MVKVAVFVFIQKLGKYWLTALSIQEGDTVRCRHHNKLA
jgi:hypothetical protein